MHYGILADGDVETAPFRMVRDDDALPSTEGDMIAWWDGFDFRWGVDGPVFDGVVEAENAFSKVDPETLTTWAMNPLVEDCELDDSCPPGPVYEIGVIDDLVGLNADSFVYLGRNFETEYNDPVAPKRNFTVRLTMVPVDSEDPYGPLDTELVAPGFPIADNDPSVRDGAWVANPPPALHELITSDGVVDISEPAYVNEPLEIKVGDTDVCAEQLPLTVNVSAVYPDTGVTDAETVAMTAVDDELFADRVYAGTLPTSEVSPVANGTPGDGTLEVFAGTVVTAEYLDCFTGTEADVVKTDQVVMQVPEGEEVPEVPIDDDLITEDGGFCSYNPNGRFDPVLPALVLIGLGYLGLRRKNLTSK
jgi:hypothetical protein